MILEISSPNGSKNITKNTIFSKQKINFTDKLVIDNSVVFNKKKTEENDLWYVLALLA